MKVKKKSRSGSEWRPFIQLIMGTRPSKGILAASLVMSVATTIVGLFIPLITKGLVDGFSLSSVGFGQVAFLIAIFIVQAVASGLSLYLLSHVGQKIVAGLRDQLWKKILVLPISFYDNHRTGDTISRMTNDTAVIKSLVTDHLSQFFTGIISIVGAITILLFLDWKMTLLMLVAVPLTLAVLLPLGRQMHRISKGLQNETARFTAVVDQVLSEIRLVKASNAEAVEYKAGKKGIDRLFDYGMKEAKVFALISPSMSFVIMALLVLIIGYGGARVSSGALTAGDLVAFILYLFQIVIPLTSFTTFFTQLQKAKGATERVITILNDNEEHFDTGLKVVDSGQNLYVSQVSFSYEKRADVLTEFDFSAESGKVTAIVGPSGGGKTTLFSLLERFYQPESGEIRLGGAPINAFTLKSWRAQIGYVSQESPLIAGTIKENICYGMEREVTEEEIERSARMAYADRFIRELPQGYDTDVGERGIMLSGGQRQRISIARALLRDPKILMLDEATSNLDSQSEVIVQKALKNLMAGRTTLVIAHRLATIIDADKILFVEKGRITGVGTHESLLQTHAKYREFATQQLQLPHLEGSRTY